MASATYLGFDSIATWLGLTAVILRTVTDLASYSMSWPGTSRQAMKLRNPHVGASGGFASGLLMP
jgi:hypothetical protein